MDSPADDAAETFNPPKTNEAGFAMSGDYPLNSRLRAEALAQAGKETDPDGIVSDEDIAGTVKRLAAEAKAEKSPRAKGGKDAAGTNDTKES